MILKTNKEFRYLFISGFLFLSGYFFYYALFNLYSIFGFILLVLLGVIILIVIVQSFQKKNRTALILGLSIIGTVTITEIATSELFKSERILEATLIDDFSSIHLTLRENKKFEVRSTYFYGPDKIFNGTYEIQNSKIIFKEKPYNNDFIPDTVFIHEDKIYLRRNKKGQPDFEFAKYFHVTRDLTGNTKQN